VRSTPPGQLVSSKLVTERHGFGWNWPEAVFGHARGNAPREIGLASDLSRDVDLRREQRRCVRVAINEKPRFARPGLLPFSDRCQSA
jgi:hypothetical protein